MDAAAISEQSCAWKELWLLIYVRTVDAIQRSTISCSSKDVICFNVSGEAHMVQYSRSPVSQLSDEEQLFSCVMCGIPAAWTKEDLINFVEPYSFDIEMMYMCNQQRSQAAALCFEDQGTLNNFIRTYDGMHYPDHPTLPPLLVVRVANVLIEEQQDVMSSVPMHVAWGETKGDEPPALVEAANSTQGAEPSFEEPVVVDTSSPTAVQSTLERVIAEGEAGLLTPTGPRWVETVPNQDRFSPIGISTSQPIFLPMCPSCLRRIDGRSTGLPISQSSVDTLMGSDEQRCKVCSLYADETHPDRRCKDCNLRENLWTCMTCAHVGCGRYTADQHAKKHFHDTLHPFCLELATGRIWDYVNDIFVHAQLQTDAAQLATVDREQTADKGLSSLDGLENELDELTVGKISNLIKEYDVFLTSQLEQQRLFYEQEIAKARVEAIQDSIQRACGGDVTEGEMNVIEELKLHISSLEAEHENFLLELRATEDVARDVRRDNQSMIREQKVHKDRITATRNRTKELRDRCNEQATELEQQIRDLDFAVRTRQRLEESPELQSGVVLVQQGEDRHRGKRKPKQRRR